MKKVLIIVFASIMMLTFTQCGNNNKNSNNTQGETKGTKEYRDLCSGLSTCLNAIDKARNCIELKRAYKDYVDEIYNSDYEFDEMCTDKELEDWEGKVDELEKIYDAKADELGCERLLRYGR